MRPVRSEADYQAAAAELERSWGAKAGTPEGDRLDVLATLVDAYESEHFPIDRAGWIREIHTFAYLDPPVVQPLDASVVTLHLTAPHPERWLSRAHRNRRRGFSCLSVEFRVISTHGGGPSFSISWGPR